jgi:uncharacterized protein (TIGR03435 family)
MRRLLIGCLAFVLAHGQRLAFEVASIKPSGPDARISIQRSGYRIATTATSLEWLIAWAYDVHRDRLYGKPKWLDSALYDIVANGPENFKREPGRIGPLQEMMQTLLADRFKLAIHSEIRELPMYSLVVASGGAKVHLQEMPQSIGQTPFRMTARGRLTGTMVTAAMLAKVLSEQLGRSVDDQTGLKGVFDFTLEWEPDEAEARGGASLFTAVHEQLGLKLEARKGPVEVFVIDRIERNPTEN